MTGNERRADHPLYRERLYPRAWVWLLGIGFGSSLGIAYGYAYGATAGWAVGAASSGLLLAGIAWSGRTAVEVWVDRLVAGRASLPLRWVGRTAPLDRERTAEASTTKADARAYLLLRTWAASTSVVVEVTDPADPHPYWLISSRRPEELARALSRATQGVRAQERDPATH